MNTNENWSKFASANAASLVAKILNDAVVFQRWSHYQGTDDHVNKGKFVPVVNIEFTILTCDYPYMFLGIPRINGLNAHLCSYTLMLHVFVYDYLLSTPGGRGTPKYVNGVYLPGSYNNNIYTLTLFNWMRNTRTDTILKGQS